MARPDGLFLVTRDGRRIPIDVKFHHVDEDIGVRYWQPVIEGDLDQIMPDVIAFDGPPVHMGEAITLGDPGPGWDTAEWGNSVMANSAHVFGFYVPGDDEVIHG